MANSKDTLNQEQQETGRAILGLLDNFSEICQSYEDCQDCLYCNFEADEEPDYNPMRCFSYYIAEEFQVDLKAYWDRKESQIEGNC